jgi:hypothetical protein
MIEIDFCLQIVMLLDNRHRQQAIVDDYRAAVHDGQAWLEKSFRSLEDLDSGLSLGSQVSIRLSFVSSEQL